jgi:hypothetical protein
LFPLNVVLFPNAALPLHVFEERYKLMVQRCLEGDSMFGVVLIESGPEVGGPAEPHRVGTVAHIENVGRMNDGRMLLSTVGRDRFRIVRITQRRPYLEADVELLELEADPSLPKDELEAVRAAVTRHNRLLLGLRGGWVHSARMPRNLEALSYHIGALLHAGAAEKQALLEEPTAAGRLRAELALLQAEAPALRKRVALEMRRRSSRQ